MSRIGNKPITVPEGVEVKIDGQNLTVKGPKGTLTREIHKNMKVNLEGNVLTVVRPNDEPANKSLHGLTRTLVNNMIEGTLHGFERKLEVNGVGYRAQKQGNKLVLTLGYSHPVEMQVPAGLTVEANGNTEITIKGIDKVLVGEFAANVRKVRQPEPYKGKGIRYKDEHIRRKEGKKAA